jgi:tetratricopeptide (TPR) repeat protein
MKNRARDLDRLLNDVAWALERGLGARDLIPMLEKVVRRAPRGSGAALFAMRELAERLVEKAPWRAAVMARDVLAHGDDDRAWAVLGIAHTLLGNYRCARKAYLRALALSPGCPWYSHNLGHLIDVGFDRPREALSHLSVAYRAEPGEAEIAASFAHALARAGRVSEARRVLGPALEDDPARVDHWLNTWLERTPPCATGVRR